MSIYNLTSNQKNCLRWLVEQVREDKLGDDFTIFWFSGGRIHISPFAGNKQDIPNITPGTIDALGVANMMLCRVPEDAVLGRACTLLGEAYEAVDSNFNAPDISFVKYLTPLADITNLDNELKLRCLPLLSSSGTDPRLWDSVVRTAGVILEERLRDIGAITSANRTGRDLVNDVFGVNGTLATRIPNDSERLGYRDLYAGVVGVFRNPYAHRFIDPTPEDGGAFVVLVNLLLKMLEDLR